MNAKFKYIKIFTAVLFLSQGSRSAGQGLGSDYLGASGPTIPGSQLGDLYLNWVYKCYSENTGFYHSPPSYGTIDKQSRGIHRVGLQSTIFSWGKEFVEFDAVLAGRDKIPFPAFDSLDVERIYTGSVTASSSNIWTPPFTRLHDESGYAENGSVMRSQWIEAAATKVRLERPNEEGFEDSFQFLKIKIGSKDRSVLAYEPVRLTIPSGGRVSPDVALVPMEPNTFMSLYPVVVKDGDRIITSLPLNENPWGNGAIQRQIRDSSIAWITGNTGPDRNPEMPRLSVSITDAPAAINVRWRFECEYRRGNGYRAYYVNDFTRNNDRVGVPNRSREQYTESMSASAEWKIYEHEEWERELMSAGFFGGLAKVFMVLDGQTEIEVCRFRIGGQNPDSEVAKEYIKKCAGDEFWYTYAIAKHETFGRVPSRFYNHFYTDFQPANRRIGARANDMGWAAWAKSWPLYNLDRRVVSSRYRQNGPGGYGLFQLTLGPKLPDGDQTSEGFIEREQIWNWQKNCDRAVAELQGKLDDANYLHYRLLEGYPEWGALPHERHLSGLDALVVTHYNGLLGVPTYWVGGKMRRTPWHPESRSEGGRVVRYWKFYPNSNNYCENINNHVE